MSFIKSLRPPFILFVALISLGAFDHLTAQKITGEAAEDYTFARISGNSMLPTLQPGEVATVYTGFPYDELRIGDIVIIESERGFNVIHRIVRRYRGNLWVTRGDNNAREDRELLTTDNFQGLALVGESEARYLRYMAKLQESGSTNVQVAMADSKSRENEERIEKLRRLEWQNG